MASPQHINVYSLSDPVTAEHTISKVLAHLRQPKYFTTALALYRRLQFGRFLPSSYLFTNRTLGEHAELDDGEPWFYAFVDRGCRPETEVWLFGSWEVEADGRAPTRITTASKDDDTNHSQPQANGIVSATSSEKDQAIHALLLSLIRKIKSLPTPPSIHPDKDVLAARSQLASSSKSDPSEDKDSAAMLPNPTQMLWGALHTTTTFHLQTLDLLNQDLLPVAPNHTFVFPLSSLPAPAALPSNLRWGKLDASHFPLVRSRTQIARQDFTLARLPNLAIFPCEPPDAAPIAWAFVGLDGSLTTLHTEAEYRRLGLGKALSAKLFREEMGFFWEEGAEKVAHGNVLVGNEASAGMCRGLGGRSVGEVYWVKVDIDAAV